MYVLVCNHLATIYWLEDGCSRLGSLMKGGHGQTNQLIGVHLTMLLMHPK